MSWTPLLVGAAADAALTRAREYIRALAATSAADGPPVAERAVMLAYTAGPLEDEAINAAYSDATDALIEAIQGRAPHVALYGGLAGTAWAASHVLELEPASLDVVDDVLGKVLAVEPWPGEYDLIVGLTGFGVYFLERIGAGAGAAARDGLARVIAQLDTLATKSDAGTAWLSPSTRKHGHDLGVAHGAAGVAAMLARAATIDDAPPRARELALSTVGWLAQQRRAPDPCGRYSEYAEQPPERRTRAAWCYGEPGVGVALLGAALRLGLDPTLARETLASAVARTEDNAGVEDAPLCHGAAGLGHIFNRAYQATRDPQLADAARTWFARALEMPTPKGFDLLEGTGGIALALVAASTEFEPNWDRLMLTDLPVLATAE